MRRTRRSRAQVIAYAMPQQKRRAVQPWIAAGLGLLTSVTIYAVVVRLFS